MTKPSVNVAPTYFVNIMVSISCRGKEYKVTCSPEGVVVGLPDTVINYQIVATDGRDIRFVGMTPKACDSDGQLSEASISQSGKLLTFSDANTDQNQFHITLEFEDMGNGRFFHDPQILNDPQR